MVILKSLSSSKTALAWERDVNHGNICMSMKTLSALSCVIQHHINVIPELKFLSSARNHTDTNR